MNLTYVECTKSLVAFPLFRSYQKICPDLKHMYLFRNKASFWGEELLAHHPTLQTGVSNLVSCLRLLIQYIRSYPPFGGRSSICNVRMHHAMVTGTHLTWISHKYTFIYPTVFLMTGHEASSKVSCPHSVI